MPQAGLETACRHAGDGDGSLVGRLAGLAAERLGLAGDVAAAKFASGDPVEDPAREQAVLDRVTRGLAGAGLRQESRLQFFRDQIEASKIIQHGLHERWRTRPEERPAGRPSLAADVRPALDRINAQLLRNLICLRDMPRLDTSCLEALLDRQLTAGPALRHLPALRRVAAATALRSLRAR